MSRRKIKKPKNPVDFETFFLRVEKLVALTEAMNNEISSLLEELDLRLTKVEEHCFPEMKKNS